MKTSWELNKIKKILQKVRNEQKKLELLSDDELKQKTKEFQTRIKKGESLDSLLPEAFGVVCEVDKRVLGKNPYDVQIMGAISMHQCYLAEMNTGEGKTLTATMPLYLNALEHKGAILVTANEYLAERDALEMAPVYEFLGLSICPGLTSDPEVTLTNEQKKDIYNHDIVYTTHGILGFDYLLNNLVTSKEDRFLRDFNYVIIDEADLVLLDSASMPLVISGSPRVQSNLYAMADFFVKTLKEEEDYVIEEKKVWFTKQGIKRAEEYFRIDNFYAHEHFELHRYVTLALRAHTLFQIEKEYVVSNNEIVLLDNESGRMLPGMKLRGGQHQALETKEQLKITQENRSVASITYQNLFQLFPKMAGMSGTIVDAKDELYKVYKKKVVVIPPNKKMKRIDKEDKFYKTSDIQFKEAIEEVASRHKTGQPVLVVTSTIADTELVTKILMQEGIAHNVLNANNAYWEADIIKEAGQLGAVTVSTGMAGRGTDIHLGKGVEELGGLVVIGIGRMTNIRLERQIRGRAGRQGDPGISQFFVSLEDEIVSSNNESLLEKYVDNDASISQRKLKKMINNAQRVHEEMAQLQRKSAFEFDTVMLKQRDIIYAIRNDLLNGPMIEDEKIISIARENIMSYMKQNKTLDKQDVYRYILDNLSYSLYNIDGIHTNDKQQVIDTLLEIMKQELSSKKESMDSIQQMDSYFKKCMLKAIDNAWVEEVDYLQQLQYAVSGRTSAQRNTLFEYQKEALSSFKQMERQIKNDMIRNILLGEIQIDKKNRLSIIFP